MRKNDQPMNLHFVARFVDAVTLRPFLSDLRRMSAPRVMGCARLPDPGVDPEPMDVALAVEAAQAA